MAIKNVFTMIKDNDIQFVDFRFTDPKGKWQHTCYVAEHVSENSFKDGIMFDGSSIAGWKEINESDMILMPDAKTIFIDPFAAQPTAVIFCDVIEPATMQPYDNLLIPLRICVAKCSLPLKWWALSQFCITMK